MPSTNTGTFKVVVVVMALQFPHAANNKVPDEFAPATQIIEVEVHRSPIERISAAVVAQL